MLAPTLQPPPPAASGVELALLPPAPASGCPPLGRPGSPAPPPLPSWPPSALGHGEPASAASKASSTSREKKLRSVYLAAAELLVQSEATLENTPAICPC